jgi:hypothetical protein
MPECRNVGRVGKSGYPEYLPEKIMAILINTIKDYQTVFEI